MLACGSIYKPSLKTSCGGKNEAHPSAPANAPNNLHGEVKIKEKVRIHARGLRGPGERSRITEEPHKKSAASGKETALVGGRRGETS
jgi:hypothetical protein